MDGGYEVNGKYDGSQRQRAVKYQTDTNLYLVDAETVHPGNKAGQRGLPCAAHSNEKQVALWLAENSEKGEEMLKPRT